MLRSVIVSAALVALAAGCKQEGGADPAEVETSGPTKGSAGGFSASLSAELGGSGSAGAEAAGTGLERTASGTAPKADDSKAGSGSADDSKTDAAKSDAARSDGAKTASAAGGAGAGSAAKTDAAKPEPAKADAAKADAVKADAAKPDPAKADAAKADAAKAASAGSGAGAAAKTEPAKIEPVKTEPAKAGSGAGSAVAQVVAPAKPVVVMTPELRAIKLSLEPNWDRDVVEAGTISLFEKNSNVTFKFHYGYEDPAAPADRDAYKKWLADNKILTTRTDRQSGAAWHIEGTDKNGRGAFRIVVTYGGKRLICYGSTYKDSGLGDLRDSVLLQAKKICETIQL